MSGSGSTASWNPWEKTVMTRYKLLTGGLATLVLAAATGLARAEEPTTARFGSIQTLALTANNDAETVAAGYRGHSYGGRSYGGHNYYGGRSYGGHNYYGGRSYGGYNYYRSSYYRPYYGRYGYYPRNYGYYGAYR